VTEPVSTVKEIVIDHVPLNTHHRFHLLPPDGHAVPGAAIDVGIVVGPRRRPCLALAAGVHGDEYDGIRALQELTREIEPERIQGTLIIVPVANPFAFAAAQRRTPEDGMGGLPLKNSTSSRRPARRSSMNPPPSGFRRLMHRTPRCAHALVGLCR